MKTIRKSLFFATTALAAASLLSTAALAQDANGEATGRGVDEIVVTAQRQAQSVLDVPLSIQARIPPVTFTASRPAAANC